MKGISPLVATVLLIAITVGIGGVISVWIAGFTQTSSSITAKQGESQILCSNAAIDISNLKYCSNNVSGIIKNNGRITIGNVTLQVVFTNASQVTIAFNDSTGIPLALRAGQLFSFNNSIGSAQYSKLYVYTNCSGVTDTADATDVTAC